MGGIGSGRRNQGGQNITSDYHCIDVRRLQRDNLLVPSLSFSWNWYCNNEKIASIQILIQRDRIILDYQYQRYIECQRETKDDRAARRADRICDKFGWMRGILNNNGNKPKGMHWKTYLQLTAKHDAFVNVALVGIAKRLGILEKLLK
ncbi:MAG: hypothetical protein CTY16_05125 [Methylobacter sp.]|nr:MAG: hypothetical protein CTY16_05125 [Methylobacter sp.]